MTEREKQPIHTKEVNRVDGDPLKTLIGTQPLREAMAEALKERDLDRIKKLTDAIEESQNS